jgi:hypothetical protein
MAQRKCSFIYFSVHFSILSVFLENLTPNQISRLFNSCKHWLETIFKATNSPPLCHACRQHLQLSQRRQHMLQHRQHIPHIRVL